MTRRAGRFAVLGAMLVVPMVTPLLTSTSAAASAPAAESVRPAGVLPDTADAPDRPEDFTATHGLLAYVRGGDVRLMSPEDPDLPEATILRGDRSREQYWSAPAWSADGRTLLTVHGSRLDRAIVLTDWAGHSEEIRPWADRSLGTASWAGDTGHLLVSRRVADTTELWALDPVSGEKELLVAQVGTVYDATMAPDGSSLAYLRPVRHEHETVHEVIGVDLVSGTASLLFEAPYGVFELRWSPDGAMIAAGGFAGLWAMETDGSEARQLVTKDEATVAHFTWAPDSERVAFSSYSDTDALLAVDVESGAVSTVTKHSYLVDEVAWQPAAPCTVVGTDGDDALAGTAGDDVICAGEGDDLVTATGGDDLVIGGGGSDRLDMSASPVAAAVDLYRFRSRGEGATQLLSVEGVIGTRFGDRLGGSPGGNALSGRGGHDLLTGGHGDDELWGGKGLDTASYHRRDDPAAEAKTPVVVDLATGTATTRDGATDTLDGIENVHGSGGADVLRGDDLDNTLIAAGDRALVEGRGGDDVISTRGLVTYESATGPVTVDATDPSHAVVTGAEGSDDLLRWTALRGSAYDDVFTGSVGAVDAAGGDDLIKPRWLRAVDGGEGTDTFDGSLLDHGVDVVPGDASSPGRWFRAGTRGRYQFPMVEVERFLLTDKRDVFGTDASEGYRVDAAGGDDLLEGGDGRDRLRGGPGDDVLRGHGGSDRLRAGAGIDDVDGGAGWDRCSFSAAEAVRGCEAPLGR